MNYATQKDMQEYEFVNSNDGSLVERSTYQDNGAAIERVIFLSEEMEVSIEVRRIAPLFLVKGAQITSLKAVTLPTFLPRQILNAETLPVASSCSSVTSDIEEVVLRGV